MRRLSRSFLSFLLRLLNSVIALLRTWDDRLEPDPAIGMGHITGRPMQTRGVRPLRR